MTVTRAVWVVIDPSTNPGPLLGAARQISDEVVALVVGARPVADDVATFGPSETRWLGEPVPPAAVEDYAAPIAKLAEQESPAAVLIAASAPARLLAGRLAARLDTSTLPDASELRTDGDAIVVTHPLTGGAVTRTEKLLSPTGVITVTPTAFIDVAASRSTPGSVVEAPCPPQVPAITVVDRRPVARSGPDLTSAKIVVGAGRGFTQQANVSLAQNLADALGGQVACTRPVAEGLNWMDRDRYLGVSGAHITPDLYLAVGISGQPQHMVGVEGARLIVAINSDSNAPIFTAADYGIVGDLNAVLPALTDALRASAKP